jgi:Tfp pilus assembly protein PilE
VFVIVGVVAMFALPKYNTTMERFRSDDGRQILNSIYASQKRYYIDNKVYAAVIATLDIELKPSTFFQLNNVYEAPGARTYLGTVNRKQGAATLYTLKIDDTAQFWCNPAATCLHLGFTNTY